MSEPEKNPSPSFDGVNGQEESISSVPIDLSSFEVSPDASSLRTHFDDDEPALWLDANGAVTADSTRAVPPSTRAAYSPTVKDGQASLPDSSRSQVAPRSELASPTNILAVLALVFGLLGTSIVPIVLGHIALSQIEVTAERGRGMAIAGLILGYAGLVSLVILIVTLISIGAIFAR